MPYRLLLTGGEAFQLDATVFQPIVNAVTDVITPEVIINLSVVLIGAGIGFAFMHWGKNKVINALMSAFKRGKLSV